MTGGTYSKRWFEVFGDEVDGAQTAREVDFILRISAQHVAPIRILDVCCGSGRHANLLAARGCQVIGVDLDSNAIGRARRAGVHGATFKQGDLRKLRDIIGNGEARFDAVICMWQSFGHFSDAENDAVLGDLVDSLTPAGVLILDVYNSDFFQQHLGSRCIERGGLTIVETKQIQDRRLTVTLNYGDGASDRFDWRLYSLEEWRAMGERHSVQLTQSCSSFDENRQPSDDQPRMQLAFVRKA